MIKMKTIYENVLDTFVPLKRLKCINIYTKKRKIYTVKMNWMESGAFTNSYERYFLFCCSSNGIQKNELFLFGSRFFFLVGVKYFSSKDGIYETEMHVKMVYSFVNNRK